jgi:anti-sigma regulatory factor (Ser/Thr protein kinase)
MLTAGRAATRLEIKANAEEIRTASNWLAALGIQHELPDDVKHRLDVCLNESLANVMAHGGPSALTNPVVLHFRYRHDDPHGVAVLTVSDAGRAFDPAHPKAPSRPQTLTEAKPGGLGLVMMQRSADHILYHRMGNRNVVTFSVRWNS